MTQTTKTIEIHAARLCQAIARIGYEPQIALMDIIDNSVTAKATQINVSLYLTPGKTLKNRNSVEKYQVVDNGSGMTDGELTNAFSLGSNGNYGINSLSKYGMGLKSAGLSLGSRIHIVSRKNGQFTSRQTFDIDFIAREDKFVIRVMPLDAAEIARFEELLPNSGTVVEIDGCENVNHQSPKTTVDKLTKKMGVVYSDFLLKREAPLGIGIRVCADSEPSFTSIVPLDILFRSGKPKELRTWDPENFDPISPYLLLKEDWKPDVGDGKTITPIKLTAVGFPRDRLAGPKSPLPTDQQKIVKEYQVGRDNAGFFIYRNGRLIQWGESLGIFNKDEYNIRVRMDLTEEHDDVLHVDVTKQRLEIDDELLARLRRILEEPREIAKKIMERCTALMKEPLGDEGAAFTDASANVPEDDPEQMAAGDPNEDVVKRIRAQATEAAEVQAANGDKTEPFKKIRYTDKVDYGHFWTPYRDPIEGVFVCINSQHPFYIEYMRDLADNSPERLLLEALIFAAGVAQTNTSSNLFDVESENIKAVFQRFHINNASYLAQFTTENINLFQST